MKIVFFGSSNFAVPSLQALAKTKHSISCVLTQPDKEKGRGLHIEGTAVKAAADTLGLKVYQPEKINTIETVNFLKSLNADLFVVASYGQILSQEVLDTPKIFSINLHASLLPKYRGAAPINWAIINGEQITGVTVIKMERRMDAGPIILQKTIGIAGEDTEATLGDKLSNLASELLLDCLVSIEDKNYKLKPQDETDVSFAPKLKKNDGAIDWNKPAEEINNLIRGCMNWPGAFTYYNGKLLKIYKAEAFKFLSPSVPQPPGGIVQVSKEGIVVATGGDGLMIKELQIESKKRMRVEEFIAGHKICAGEVFSF